MSATNVCPPFFLSRDPDDSLYIDLAVDASAAIVVSRDNDLLSLRDPSHPDSRLFLARYPNLLILDPVSFLRSLDIPVP